MPKTEAGAGGLKAEEEKLHQELFTVRRQLEAKQHSAKKLGAKYKAAGASPDTVDDKEVEQMLAEADRLEQLLEKLEQASKTGESQDEVKVEIEKLRESIHQLK